MCRNTVRTVSKENVWLRETNWRVTQCTALWYHVIYLRALFSHPLSSGPLRNPQSSLALCTKKTTYKLTPNRLFGSMQIISGSCLDNCRFCYPTEVQLAQLYIYQTRNRTERLKATISSRRTAKGDIEYFQQTQ